MTIRSIALASILVAGTTFSLTGCKKDEATLAAEAKIKELSVDALAGMVKAGKAHVFDANGESTREKYGIIPGAKLLASSSDYDLAALPAEKDASLVFYCSNTMCSAGEGAAKRAALAGYDDVSVLPVGIKGWSESGQKTEKVPNS